MVTDTRKEKTSIGRFYSYSSALIVRKFCKNHEMAQQASDKSNNDQQSRAASDKSLGGKPPEPGGFFARHQAASVTGRRSSEKLMAAAANGKRSCRVPPSYGSLDNNNNNWGGGGGAGGGGGRNDAANKTAEFDESGEHNSVAGVIGQFGWFQFCVLLFSGLREGLVGYDALITSVILRPESNFFCADNVLLIDKLKGIQTNLINQHEAASTTNNNKSLLGQTPTTGGYNSYKNYDFDGQWNETAQCFRSLDGGKTLLHDESGQLIECQSWLFPAAAAGEGGPSLVAEWSLVCHNHWLVATIESAFFFGLMCGNLLWGYYADKWGRRPAYLAAHTIATLFGALAVVAPSMWLFALFRFITAVGSIGYNIIYSIQVELIGTEYRSFCTILNHLGWGLGVICVPLIDHLASDYRPLVALAPLLSLIMLPWALWLPESPRWLMANNKFPQAREELLRAAKFNGKAVTNDDSNGGGTSSQLEKRISALEAKVRCEQQSRRDSLRSEGLQERRSYGLIFGDKQLLRDTLILSYVSFCGHIFYYVLTINFAYVKNLTSTANFIISGAGEWFCVVMGALLLKILTRKTCMSLCFLFMMASFLFQSLIDSGVAAHLDTPTIITTNNAIGTLSALLLIFIALIVNQEVYPTVVRQTGTSLTNTLGETGSTLAPLMIQLSRMLGSWRADLIFGAACSVGMVATQFVTRTDDIELPDA